MDPFAHCSEAYSDEPHQSSQCQKSQCYCEYEEQKEQKEPVLPQYNPMPQPHKQCPKEFKEQCKQQ